MLIRNEQPLISIIMPTYNHGEYLLDAIHDVTRQTYETWELLIVDDGSPDDTESCVKEFIARHEFVGKILYLRQENKGAEFLSETYNYALSMATGEYVAIFEGDDRWPDDKLEIQVDDFLDDDVVLSYGNYDLISEDGELIKKYNLEKLYSSDELENRPIGHMATLMAQYAKATITFPCTVILRRTALDKVGGFIGCGGGVDLIDFPTFLEISRLGNFVFHADTLGSWRRHSRQLTSKNHREITNNVYSYAKQFSKRNPEYVDYESMHDNWHERFRWIEFQKARTLAVVGKWRESRASFINVIRMKGAPNVLAIASVVGFVATLFHLKIDKLVKSLN